MANFKETGVKISQFPDAPVNSATHRYKLELNHKIISWAPSYYGISTINKNYQISLQALRSDLMGYIGIDNAKGDYQNYITFWKGNWSDADRTNSYIYEWDDLEYSHKDYIKNKHGLDIQHDIDNRIERVFILDTAPWPLEATDTDVNIEGSNTYGIDPNPISKKLVNKNYVDERHNGFRKVEKALDEQENQQFGSTLEIRPYTCFYQYSQPCAVDSNTGIRTINICDTQIMEDGRTIKDMLRHNRLPFYIRLTNHDTYHQIEGVHKCNLKILVNGEDKAIWSYEDELVEIVRENRNIRKQNEDIINVGTGYIFIRCEAEYIDDVFTVTCSNFFGRDKKSRKITRVEFPQTPETETPTENSLGVIEAGSIDLDLSLHEHETFLTNIPSQDVASQGTVYQYYINFDASGLDDYHEYTWDYFVITPDQELTVRDDGSFSDKFYDDVIFQGNNTQIMWANSDTYNTAPHLQPNKVYCFEFVKVFDNLLIGRIKYYINLVKKT